MLIYYLIFFLSFLLCWLDYSKDKIVKASIYFLFCFILIMLPGFKTLGTDNDGYNYEQIFYTAGNYSLLEILTGDYWENIERGYMLLNKIVVVLGGNITTLFTIVAILTGVLNYTFFYKLNKFAFTSLLFYISFFYIYRDFTQIRYGLSCAIAYWAVFFLLKRKYIAFFGSLALSFLFHSSAIILVIIIPFVFFFKNRYFYVFLPFICLIGLYYNPFPVLLSIGGIPEHMTIYLEEEGGAGFMLSVFGFGVILLYIFNYQKFSNVDYSIHFYFRLFAFGVALNLLFIQSAIFQRFTYLLFQFGVVLLPTMIEHLQKNANKWLYVFLHFMIISFMFYYSIKVISPSLLRPYF